jgi:transposase
MVLCVDKKAQIQALDRTQPILPMRPGLPERRTHDYTRHGTISLFAPLDAAGGKVIGEFHRGHRAVEFRKFLETIDKEVPADLEVHLILDNYATHKTPTVQRWLLRHPRFHLHFTPTYSCWLNLVERWFSLLTEKWIRRGTHRSTPALELSIKHWLDTWNEQPRPFAWTKTADEILTKKAAASCLPTASRLGTTGCRGSLLRVCVNRVAKRLGVVASLSHATRAPVRRYRPWGQSPPSL